MSDRHKGDASPPARTYTAREPLAGSVLTCPRCSRSYAYPQRGAPAIRCECGWWYTNVDGRIEEEFKHRFGV